MSGDCGFKPGDLEENGYNKTVRDFDWALLNAGLSGAELCLVGHARIASWSLADQRSARPKSKNVRPYLVRFNMEKIAEHSRHSLSALYKARASLVSKGLLVQESSRKHFRIEKDFRTWIDEKTNERLLSDSAIDASIACASKFRATVSAFCECVQPEDTPGPDDDEEFHSGGIPHAENSLPVEKNSTRVENFSTPVENDSTRVEKNSHPVEKSASRFIGTRAPDPLEPLGTIVTLLPTQAADDQTHSKPQAKPGIPKTLDELYTWSARAVPEIEHIAGKLAGWTASYPVDWIHDAIQAAIANSDAGGIASYAGGCLRKWHRNGGPPHARGIPVTIPISTPTNSAETEDERAARRREDQQHADRELIRKYRLLSDTQKLSRNGIVVVLGERETVRAEALIANPTNPLSQIPATAV